jgi:hypothetical protein
MDAWKALHFAAIPRGRGEYVNQKIDKGAPVAAFLVGPGGQSITGRVIPVDGGLSAA